MDDEPKAPNPAQLLRDLERNQALRHQAVAESGLDPHLALLRTWHATPEPKWVVALGDCAVNCGVFAGSPAVVGPLADILPVDLHVPGCPPAPLAIVKALLALMEVQA